MTLILRQNRRRGSHQVSSTSSLEENTAGGASNPLEIADVHELDCSHRRKMKSVLGREEINLSKVDTDDLANPEDHDDGDTVQPPNLPSTEALTVVKK